MALRTMRLRSITKNTYRKILTDMTVIQALGLPTRLVKEKNLGIHLLREVVRNQQLGSSKR